MKGPLYFVGVLALLSSAQGAHQGLEFRFWASKSDYSIGEPVEVIFSWKNVSPDPLKVERWRGPTAGVTAVSRDESVLDFQIIAPNGKPLPYHGEFACGGPRVFDVLQPGQERTSHHVLTGIKYGSYDLLEPGVYVLKSAYASYTYRDHPELEKDGAHWDGLIAAPDVEITIHPASASSLPRYRERAREGDDGAIQYLGMNRDQGSVEVLEAAYASGDWNRRNLISEALATIGSDAAVAALGRLAKTVEKQDRAVLLNALGDSKNPAAIPILQDYLKLEDDYLACSTESEGSRYKILVTRKVAAGELRKFSITVPDSIWKIPMGKGEKAPNY